MRNPLAWSFLAVVLSVIALAVAVVSLRVADRNGSDVVPVAQGTLPASTAPEASTPGPSDDPETETPTEVAEPTATNESMSTSLPTAGAAYTIVREKVPVRLAGGSSRYLDLDQPMVNSNSYQTDVVYTPNSSSTVLRFSSANVAEAKSADVTPDECAQAIQLSPSDTQVEASQDLVLCAVTNGIGAVSEPARTKMAKIIVNSVAKDGSLDLSITTWEIPR
jgi:hypothetical protein